MVLLASMSYMYMAIIVPMALVAPLFCALYYYRYLPVSLKLFTGYLLLNAAGNILAAILAAQRINNLPVLHVYTIFEFVLLSLFYRALLPARMSVFIYAIMGWFAAFSVVNSVYLQSIYQYNSYARSVSCIMITIYAVLYFKQALDSPDAPDIRQRIFSYINAGLLIYFGGSFFLFLSANHILENFFMNTIFWNIHATLVLLMYLLFTTGLLHAKSYR